MIDLREYSWAIDAIAGSSRARDEAAALAPILMQYFKPKSVIDLGCGPGVYIWPLRDEYGLEVHGVDGCPQAAKYGPIEIFDLREPYHPSHEYDLCISIETLEHIESDFAHIAVSSIARCAPIAFVTAAPPGFGGTLHVNEQPREYWIEKFLRAGMEYDESLTRELSDLFNSNPVFHEHGWLIHHLMIMRRKMYAENDVLKNQVYEGLSQFFSEYAKRMPCKYWSLLEVGSGGGEGTIVQILRDAGFNFDRLEITTYPEVDVQSLPKDYHGQFDFVLADQVLEHVERPWDAAREMHRALRPGGMAISASPFFFYLHHVPIDCWRISEQGYGALFRSVGFEILETGCWGTMAAQAWAFAHNKGDLSFIPVKDAKERGFFNTSDDDWHFPAMVWCVARKTGRIVIDLNDYSDDLHTMVLTQGPQADALVPILMQYFSPKSVIDLGCGCGQYIWRLRDWYGVEVHGVDGCPEAAKFGPTEIFDLREPYYPQRQYDLCMSIETLEHIEEEYAQVVVESIARCAPVAYITAAPPGQSGHHHINLQPQEYWRARFSEAGMEYDQALSHKLRSVFGSPDYPPDVFRSHGFLINSSMVFRRRA